MKKLTSASLGAAALTALLLAGSVSPAFAAPGTSKTAVASSTTSTTTGVDEACLAAVNTAISRGETGISTDVCTYTQTVTVSAPAQATPADIQAARGTLSKSDYQSLQAAAAAGAVQSKTFNRTYDNVVVAWHQSGRFYYNGSRAWVSTTYSGATGYQSCVVDRAIGYIIEVKKCDESGTTTTRNLRAMFHSSVVPSGGTVNWDTEWHTYVNATGSVWW